MSDTVSLTKHTKPLWKNEDWFGNARYAFCRTFLHHSSTQIGLHANEFYELNIITEGDAIHAVNGITYEAPAGSICFTHPGTEHGFLCKENTTIFHALIRDGFFERYEHELRSFTGYTLLFEVDPYIRLESGESLQLCLTQDQFAILSSVIRELLRIEGGNYEGKETLKNSAMLYMIGTLSSFTKDMEKWGQNRKSNPYAVQIGRNMEYIRLHCRDHLTIDMLAEQLAMSTATYQRQFQSIAGCTPIRFLTRCRMAQARRYLAYSTRTITEVAMDCGFYDTSHFIRTFLKSEGINPSEYRTLYFHNAKYPSCTICSQPAAGGNK